MRETYNAIGPRRIRSSLHHWQTKQRTHILPRVFSISELVITHGHNIVFYILLCRNTPRHRFVYNHVPTRTHTFVVSLAFTKKLQNRASYFYSNLQKSFVVSLCFLCSFFVVYLIPFVVSRISFVVFCSFFVVSCGYVEIHLFYNICVLVVSL